MEHPRGSNYLRNLIEYHNFVADFFQNYPRGESIFEKKLRNYEIIEKIENILRIFKNKDFEVDELKEEIKKIIF